MHVFQRFYKYLLLLGLGIVPFGISSPAHASACPEAALSQVVRHRTDGGESLSSIAIAYNLLPATLVTMNPTLPSEGALPSGTVVAVPPFNGSVVQVSAGQTWQVLAESYSTRADLLFEINGCPTELPSQVFIPTSSRLASTVPAPLAYPLPASAPVILSYGWQPHPQRDELVFNSGIALGTQAGTEVKSAAEGTIAFVGETNGAVMVVINHRDGLQTRYGNLENVSLTVGEVVPVGSQLGTVVGANATDSFVYFEVRTNSSEGWIARNPGLYLSELELQR